MQGRQIQCPACKRSLIVPPQAIGRMVRCGKCSHAFKVALDVSDDDILDWLSPNLDEEEEAAITVRPEFETNAPLMEGGGGSAPAASATQQALEEPIEPITEKIRLVRIDDHGALFEFPASRLLETSFRCSMPRTCLRCGAKSHLQAHVIHYAHALLSGVDVEAEHAAGAMKLTEEEAQDLSEEDLLARLPRVPNVPSPGDLPMPYWLCDMCTTGNCISAELQVDGSGNGRCRLLILHLRRAEEFMVTAGGEGQSDFAKLHGVVASLVESPWDNLAQFVQDRIRQWWKPRHNERFLGYAPDRDHVRNEDGVAGIVVSTERLIYHTRQRHYECSVAEPLDLELAMGSHTGQLRIHTGNWKVKHFTVDRDGVSRFRRCLTLGKFRANWR
ncbi:MAG: hypothetical protein BWX88_04104 [Planctomycetes bacterium ADurb.Bin126]|nr:MAG: hypothetical protein BWX88_04104 [Planctomycetes bacterium ADurb.Bin126]